MRSGIARLRSRIADLQALDIEALQSGEDPAIEGLQKKIEATIASVYGPTSHEYSRLHSAWCLDDTTYVMTIEPAWGRGGGRGGGPSIEEIRDGVRRGRDHAIALLQGAAEALDEELGYAQPAAHPTPQPEPSILSPDVFVVYGHDDAAEQEVARFISKCGLTPVILHEKASGGRTVIEKLEYYSDVSFAVVLLTPDDKGGTADSAPDELRPRARQNVIAELFYFIGKLGRANVCALKKGEIEIPSDIGGVVYTPMDTGVGWKTSLIRELEAAGHHVDWRKALS